MDDMHIRLRGYPHLDCSDVVLRSRAQEGLIFSLSVCDRFMLSHGVAQCLALVGKVILQRLKFFFKLGNVFMVLDAAIPPF